MKENAMQRKLRAGEAAFGVYVYTRVPKLLAASARDDLGKARR